jgi:hypothetical protein
LSLADHPAGPFASEPKIADFDGLKGSISRAGRMRNDLEDPIRRYIVDELDDGQMLPDIGTVAPGEEFPDLG